MMFRLLGPVEIVGTEGFVPAVGGPKRRAVLAALALAPNQVVEQDAFVGRVWGDDPPTHARTALHGHISCLRKVIGNDARLRRRASGYELVVDPDAVDASLFDRLVGEAQHASDARAAELLGRALGLWHGAALTGTASSLFLEAAATRLTESRLRALESLATRLIRLDHPVEAAAALEESIAENPLREQLATLAVRALRLSGRRAAALEVYQRAAQALAAELDVEPSAALRGEYAALMAGATPHPVPGCQRRARPANVPQRRPVVAPLDPPRRRRVPAQLPMQDAVFAGRDDELAWLDSRPSAGDVRRILVISGEAGVGKTALAVRYGHRIADRFPDGQLHVDLRGFDEREPLSADAVLIGFLQALGVPTRGTGPDQRATLYQAATAGRRILVVLDNALDERQVRPLLPGGPGCLTVVTSRVRMEGLVAREGALHLGLEPLRRWAAVDVLAGLVGRERIDAEPEAAFVLAALCDHLPLALRTIGARLVTRPSWHLQAVLDELSDERRRLTALVVPRLGPSLKLTASTLTREEYQALRFIGVHPGPEIDPFTAAALLESTVPVARRQLEGLAGVHLLTERVPGRYVRRQLVRLYTQQLLDEERESVDAVRRLLDYYLRATEVAGRVLEDHAEPAGRMGSAPPGSRRSHQMLPPFEYRGDALRWVESEEMNMRVLVAQAARLGEPLRASRLAGSVESFRQLRRRER